MRKLMWFTLGFGIACAVGSYLLFGNVLAVLAAGLYANIKCGQNVVKQSNAKIENVSKS